MTAITAIIPVKGSSSRLPGKNILPFADSTLLEYKIEQLKQVKGIDRILVSSDSDRMLDIAKKHNVDIDKRPVEYADESQPFGLFLRYLCSIVQTDTIMWACCTSPLITSKKYDEAITIYKNNCPSNKDSLITVYKFQHFLMNDNGPLNFARGLKHKNSQDLPPLYIFTNGIIIVSKENILKWNYHFGPNPYYMEVSQKEAIDIDTYWDYVVAKAYYADENKR